MSKYGYLKVFQRVSSTSRQRESIVHVGELKIVFENSIEPDYTAHLSHLTRVYRLQSLYSVDEMFYKILPVYNFLSAFLVL